MRKSIIMKGYLSSQKIKGIVALALAGCWFCSSAWSAVILPIEVMGTPPYTETVTLEVAAGSNMTGAKLVVRAHNVSYDNKGKIKVNNSAQFMIWNNTPQIQVAEPDRSYGGFGGGFSTVKFSMESPAITLTNGYNTIEFTYNWKNPDHGTAGYRIIGLDIVDAAGNSLLVPDQMSFDDPATWVAPLTNATDIAAGEYIWYNANLDGKGLSCTHCHTDDGRDLKYFNISNKTIFEQVKKETDPSFTDTEALQVVSYIRSLDLGLEGGLDVVPQARPWNPPYQPGPGTDSRPVDQWAAGAGLDAVLASDADMLPYMFGSGTQAEIDAATDIRSNLNLREIPISLQFPDWIHWMPRVHPMQLWGRNYWETEKRQLKTGETDTEWNNPHEAYLDLKGQFEGGLATQSGLINRVRNDFQTKVLWWIDPGDKLHPWCEQEGKIIDAAKARGYTAEVTKLNLSRWRAVKLWGLFHTYNAEDKADNLNSKAEKYQWPAEYYSVFQIAAHFIGDDRGTSCFEWEMDTPEIGIYYSSIWYQLQMVLNPGMRNGGSVAPVDWAYNHAHVNLLGEQTGIHEPLRLVQNLIKCYQQRDRSGKPVSNTWTMREVSPWRHYSDFNGDQTSYELLDTYGYGNLRLKILRSMLSQFLRRVNEYDVSDWTRTSVRDDGGDSWWQIMVPEYFPQEDPDDVTNYKLFAQSGIGDAIDADAMLRLIPRLNRIGLEPSLVLELADWCNEMWPLLNWQALATDSDGDSLQDYWEFQHYGTLDWGPNDDPNSTGIINRDAYDFGTSSNRTETVPQLAITQEGDQMAFAYERPKFMEGSQFVIDYSTNLVTWHTEAVYTTRTDEMDELYESVTQLHDLSDDAMFFRVRREDPAPSIQFTNLSNGDGVMLGYDLNITAKIRGIDPDEIMYVYVNRLDLPNISADNTAPYTFKVNGANMNEAGPQTLTLWLRYNADNPDGSQHWIGSGPITITVVAPE